ncbi:MAG: hypothetical protein ACTS73_04060 [Arsenophonus sp. NEOnobi-MAG3]
MLRLRSLRLVGSHRQRKYASQQLLATAFALAEACKSGEELLYHSCTCEASLYFSRDFHKAIGDTLIGEKARCSFCQ